MQGSKQFILTCFYVTISLHLVFSADKPADTSITTSLASFMNIAKSMAGEQSLPILGNISQEFCRNSLKKVVRYRKIIMLQEQVNLKAQAQFLEQLQDCSNLRQSVRKLIGKYEKVKTELNNLKASLGLLSSPEPQ